MKTILIIDDHKDLSEVIQYILAHAGYRVILAYDSRHGLEKAREEVPELVLMDVMLPDIDGAEAVRSLKQDERTQHIPVVFMCPWVTEGSGEQNSIEVEGHTVAVLPQTLDKEAVVARLEQYISP